MGSPSTPHVSLLTLFKNRPELAPELLRKLGVALPDYSEVRVDSEDLTEVQPAEYRADLVVSLVAGEPVLGIVLEVQLGLKSDDPKLYTWPVYLTNLRARLRCPTCVLVVTPSETVAARAARPIHLGPGSVVTPLVVGPSAVPIIVDEAAAIAEPELAILSVIAHGKGNPDVATAIAQAAFNASRGLDDERALLYLDWIVVSLGRAARAAFGEFMAQGNYEYQSDYLRGLLARGRAEGRTETRAEDLLEVLDARGLMVSSEQRDRVRACTDLETLRSWLRKAAVISDVAQLFAD